MGVRVVGRKRRGSGWKNIRVIIDVYEREEKKEMVVREYGTEKGEEGDYIQSERDESASVSWPSHSYLMISDFIR